MRTLKVYTCCLLLCGAFVVNASGHMGRERLLYGEILYESLQGNHLDALLKFSTAQPLENGWSLSSNLTITDLQLNFGLSDLAEQDINAGIGSNNIQQSKNRSAYLLAWFYFNKHKSMQALQALDMIQGEVDSVSTNDVLYLQALLNLRLGKFKAAGKILEGLPANKQAGQYILYNLAMAQLQSGDEARGRSTLSSLGQIETSEADILALKDLANIKLGYRYLQDDKLEQAKASFNRVRLDSPFTNHALLGSGWSSFSMGNIERAIVAWSLLHEKEAINDTVIEAKLALPYAYSKLGAHGKAANLYAHATELFEAELIRLETTAKAIRSGDLRQAIIDRHQTGSEWFITLSRLHDQKEQFYLPVLLENEEFSELADTLHELALVKNRVAQAQTSITAYIELAQLKQKHYAITLPAVKNKLYTIYESMQSMMPDVPQQASARNRSSVNTRDITQLRSTYADILHVHKTTVSYSQQLPEYIQQLSALATELQSLDKKLNTMMIHTGEKLEIVAINILQKKRELLESYRNNALFALAESYDLATGKRQ